MHDRGPSVCLSSRCASSLKTPNGHPNRCFPPYTRPIFSARKGGRGCRGAGLRVTLDASPMLAGTAGEGAAAQVIEILRPQRPQGGIGSCPQVRCLKIGCPHSWKGAPIAARVRQAYPEGIPTQPNDLHGRRGFFAALGDRPSRRTSHERPDRNC